jgi:plasmid stabilization system protein ParE
MVVTTVIWTDTAVRERRKILNYWTKRNKSSTYSEKLIFKIQERVQFLIKNPKSFIRTNYKNIRTSTLGHYKTTEKELIVIAFWDNRQNPKKLFKILKKH